LHFNKKSDLTRVAFSIFDKNQTYIYYYLSEWIVKNLRRVIKMTCETGYSKTLMFGAILVSVILFGLAFWYIRHSKQNQIQQTLAIIKPDAVAAGNIGKIIDRIEKDGFKIITMKKLQLAKEQAQEFYAVHKDKPFFDELVSFMSSGPIVAMVLEKESGVQAWRNLMGNTNPEKAEAVTLRKLFGTDMGHNAVHGSDSPESAKTEIRLIFPEL
jgi:nucleoside-diphosphate kinase